MVVRIAVAIEVNGNFRVDAGPPEARKVSASVKGKPISARFSVARQVAATAVSVGDAGSDFNPIAGRFACALCRFAVRGNFDPSSAFKPLELDKDSTCGLAQRSIQYVS